MDNGTTNKKRAIGYFFFSGISTFLAFFLPVHLWASINGYAIAQILPAYMTLVVWDIFLVFALYHGNYRLKTMVSDLGIKRTDTLKKISDVLFSISLLMLAGLNICIFWLISTSS